MKRILDLSALACAMALAACTDMATSAGDIPPPAPAEAAPAASPNSTVGGAAMHADRTIAENASAAPNLSTLVSALKGAELVQMLSGAGPFTVFAPTNDAFGRLQPGMVDALLKPENKPQLTRVLTYHLVPGTITAADLRQRIQAGGGTANLTTVSGDVVTARYESDAITLTDMNGTRSYVETPDVRQSNGVVHVINGVLVPRL